MNKLNLNKIKQYFLIFLILFSIISLYLYLNEKENYLAVELQDICGDYPEDFERVDIANNSNYIFVNDPNFTSTKLWDIEGNTVFVNSFIECEYYVTGGWSFKPNNENRVDYTSITLTIAYRNFLLLIILSGALSYFYRLYVIKNNKNSIAYLLIIFLIFYFLYIYQQTFTNSTFTAKILATSFIFCISQYLLYKKNIISNYPMTYLIISLIIVFLFSFSQNDNRIYYQNFDNFGDTVSLISTFDYFFDSQNLKQIKNYDFEKYFEQNIYFSDVKNEYCSTSFGKNYKNKLKINPICIGGNYNNTPRHYSLPPMYLFVNTIFGYVLFLLKDMYLLLSLLTLLTFLSIYLVTKTVITENKFIYFIFQIASFPILFALQRGNFISILNYCLVFLFSYRILKLKKFDFITLLSLSLAINLRPNQIILCLLLLNSKNIFTFLKLVFKTFAYAGIAFALFLKLNTIFHKEYNLEAFLQNFFLYGIEVLNQDLTVFGYGDGFNNSLYSLLKIFKDEFSPIFKNLNLLKFDNIISTNNLNYFVLTLLAFYLIFITLQYFQDEITHDTFFIKLIVATLLISPKLASYHIGLLLLPFLLFTKKQIIRNENILTLIILILLPKPHSFEFPIYGISLGLVINTVLLTVVLFFEEKQSRNKYKLRTPMSSKIKNE